VRVFLPRAPVASAADSNRGRDDGRWWCHTAVSPRLLACPADEKDARAPSWCGRTARAIISARRRCQWRGQPAGQGEGERASPCRRAKPTADGERNCTTLHPEKNNVLDSKFAKKNDILFNLPCVHVRISMQQSLST
jgi:hypothetical protein